jgi:hypothetical protein
MQASLLSSTPFGVLQQRLRPQSWSCRRVRRPCAKSPSVRRLISRTLRERGLPWLRPSEEACQGAPFPCKPWRQGGRVSQHVTASIASLRTERVGIRVARLSCELWRPQACRTTALSKETTVCVPGFSLYASFFTVVLARKSLLEPEDANAMSSECSVQTRVTRRKRRHRVHTRASRKGYDL